MKANPRLRALLVVAAAASLTFVSGCSERRVAPSPAPTPTPTPTPPPVRPAVDWQDAPITPGDWTWSMEGGRSVARFAGGQVVLRCEGRGQSVTLLRAGTSQGPVPVTITTTAMTRPLTGQPQPGNPPAIAVSFTARDPILDAMAFSRGRFALDVAGLPTLYVPSWPEVSRVIEDCR